MLNLRPRFALVLIVLLAAACARMETALPAYPPAKLKRVDLRTAPPPAPEPTTDPLLAELRCGMSVAEVNDVLKRMGFSPLRPAGGSRYVSRSGKLEARLTFDGGFSAGVVAVGNDAGSELHCSRP